MGSDSFALQPVGNPWQNCGKSSPKPLQSKPRTQKKVLSLVLCVAMMLSVMVMSTGATSFTDEDKVSDNYAEAVEVLTGMGVIKGDDNNAFRPQDSITRAEVSTLIYRAATADVNNGHPGLTAGANLFTDVSEDDWFAGYVNYCADAEYVKGYEDNTFRAANDVTGYEVLAMILRAVGYDKNNEFTGLNWTIQVASTATKLDMLENLDSSVDLAEPASREVVAELIFQAIGPDVDTVHFSPAAGTYREEGTSLGEQQFNLAQTEYGAIDEWGRPGYEWINTKTGDAYATIKAEPVVTYTEAVTECDVAADTNVDEDVTYAVTVNGQNAVNYKVQPTDTVQKIGAQGRLTEVYYDYDGEGSDAIVMIDTFLAQVTKVEDATFDANGHTKTEATITLFVYDGSKGTEGQSLVLTNGKTNYDYDKDDMVLVNAYTQNAKVATGKDASGTIISSKGYGEIVGLAESIVGAQTVIHYNDGKHTVSGTTYDDAAELHLDKAGKDASKNYTWYFDQYDNLIGSAVIATTYSYGTIKNIQWINPTGAAGYAQATMVYMDGSEQTQTIASIANLDTAYNTSAEPGSNDGKNIYVSTSQQDNYAEFGGAHMYRIETNADGSLDLTLTKQVDNATVEQGASVVRGSNGTFYTNNATQYLVKDGSGASATYTPVTGYTNIDTYSNATVDYAVVDKNGFAEYVYIIGTPDSATGSGLFYLSTNSYREILDAEDGSVDYYELTGYVDGVPGTIKVATESFKNAIIGNVGGMFIVNYTDGEVTSLGNSNQPISGFKALDDVTGYDGQSIRYVPADSATVVLEEGVLQITAQDGTIDAYNIVGQVNVLGDMPADGDISDKNVYVVYSNTETVRIASQVYISDKDLSGTDGTDTPADPDSATVYYVLNVQDKVTGQTTTYTANVVLGPGSSELNKEVIYPAEWAVNTVQAQNDITFSAYDVVGVASYTDTLTAGDTAIFVFTIRV